MGTEAVERPIEREYRNVVSDNLRWNRFVPRPGDIFVCTPPKCGTTWMQAIVTSLLFPDGDAPGSVSEISPWIDARFEPIDVIAARLEAQTYRRAIKTHTAADGIPWYPAASYIVVGRDGRDAFMSFLNHMRNLRPEVIMELVISASQEGIDLGEGGPPPVDDVHEFFAWCMENPIWFEHVASFWSHHGEPNVLFAHFNDMKADLDAQMRRVAAFLSIEVDDERWPEVVDRCTFESMKARSDEIADFAGFVGGAETFLYKGSNGRWRDVLTIDELATFDRRSRELLPPDAIAWTTSGEAALHA
jgi:aryl sulfotransferase